MGELSLAVCWTPEAAGPLEESPAGADTVLSVHQVQNPPQGTAACSLCFPYLNSRLIYFFDFLKGSQSFLLMYSYTQ